MIDLREKLGKLSERWSPRVVAGMNGYRFKLAKAQGEFVRHGHADADEVFIVADGNLRIEFRDGAVEPGPGEM
jgi:mannose-6-phosphate isomerase-like protein (cupin superfamily)